MSEYTPTTENIRQTFAYVRAGLDHDDGYPFVMEFHVEAFDRWLAQIKAEAWDEGFDAGIDHAIFNEFVFNPYSIKSERAQQYIQGKLQDDKGKSS